MRVVSLVTVCIVLGCGAVSIGIHTVGKQTLGSLWKFSLFQEELKTISFLGSRSHDDRRYPTFMQEKCVEAASKVADGKGKAEEVLLG